MQAARIELPDVTLIEDAPLRARNTLRVAARSTWLAELRDPAALPALLAQPALRAAPLLVLGGGSNVLFIADWPGLIVQMRNDAITVMDETADPVHLRVGAGMAWDDLVRWTLARGLAGLENLILIPGSVGAAPIQNIGAYGVEVAAYIQAVEAWDRAQDTWVTLAADDCAFGYRDSCFKREPARWIITAVHLALPRQAPLQLDYAGIRAELTAMGVADPRPPHVAEAVLRLRTRKLPDPAQIGNAGSFFKNPVLDAAQAATLMAAFPAVPHWPQDDGRSKISAAWLIEQAGCKGLRTGDAGISDRHALVLVNHGAASGAQLWALAQEVQARVQQRFGVMLEPEPRVLPEAHDRYRNGVDKTAPHA